MELKYDKTCSLKCSISGFNWIHTVKWKFHSEWNSRLAKQLPPVYKSYHFAYI